MQKIDPQGLSELAYHEIKAAQEALRDRFPTSPLLPLVELKDGKGLVDRSFEVIMGEHSGWERRANFFGKLGIYVDLLRDELKNPRFSA